MKRNTEKTRMFFVKDPTDGEITAVMPDDFARNSNIDGTSCVTCYAHIGQHGSCCKEWVREQKLATPEEYASLLKELKSRGYNITILNKKTYKWATS